METAVLINYNSNIYKLRYTLIPMGRKGQIAWNRGKGKMQTIQICIICQKSHTERHPSINPKYCSRECYFKSKIGVPSKLKGRKSPNSGNRTERAKGEKSHLWKGGIDTNYPGEFRRKLRYLIKERDGFKCSKCGSNERLIVHHKDKNKKNSSLDNLITMCKICHGRLHNE